MSQKDKWGWSAFQLLSKLPKIFQESKNCHKKEDKWGWSAFQILSKLPKIFQKKEEKWGWSDFLNISSTNGWEITIQTKVSWIFFSFLKYK